MNAPLVQMEAYISNDVYLALQAQGLHRSDLAQESPRLMALHFYQDNVLSVIEHDHRTVAPL